MEFERMLKILKNPYGYSHEERRIAMTKAGGILEQGRCKHGSEYTEWIKGEEVWKCCHCDEIVRRENPNEY